MINKRNEEMRKEEKNKENGSFVFILQNISSVFLFSLPMNNINRM
jgi:hypothetical protein